MCCRIRPYHTSDNECTVISPNIIKLSSSGCQFSFDRVFDRDSTQEEVFLGVVNPLIKEALTGFNCTIFTYGQTSSGKTYTMHGDPKQRGILPRTATALFEAIKTCDNNTHTEVKISVLEIYQERLRDLLFQGQSTDADAKDSLRIRESTEGLTWIEGLSEFTTDTEQSFNEYLNIAFRKRMIGAHSMNIDSSRSHFCCIISIFQAQISIGQRTSSKFYLVDLAGSEMVRKTDASGIRLNEAKYINKSLSALGNVIFALSLSSSSLNNDPSSSQQQRKQHIPFRDSKLTRLLQNSLGGNSKTVLILTVAEAREHHQETIATLRFGERARLVCTKPKVNSELEERKLKVELSHARQRIVVLMGTINELQQQLVQEKEVHNEEVSKLKSQLFLSSMQIPVSPKPNISVRSDAIRVRHDDALDTMTCSVCRTSQSSMTGAPNAIVNNNAPTNLSDVGIMHNTKLLDKIAEINASRDKQSNNAGNSDGHEQVDSSEFCAVCGLGEEESLKLRLETGEALGPMFTCDGNCGYCFHARCVGLLGDGGQYSLPDGEWFCTSCSCISSSDDAFHDDIGTAHTKADTNNTEIVKVKADYHMMRRERNRVLAQWQQEKRIAAALEERRKLVDKQRDVDLVAAIEEIRRLRSALEVEKEESSRLTNLQKDFHNLLGHKGNSMQQSPRISFTGDLTFENVKSGCLSPRSYVIRNRNELGSLHERDESFEVDTKSRKNNVNNLDSNLESPFSHKGKAKASIRLPQSHSTSSMYNSPADNSLNAQNANNSTAILHTLSSTPASNISCIPKPWIKQAKSHARAPVPLELVASHLVGLDSECQLDEGANSIGKKDIGNAFTASVECEAEGEGNKYLIPLKNRLKDLLRTVREETGSYAEIRQRHKDRDQERGLLKSRARDQVQDHLLSQSLRASIKSPILSQSYSDINRPVLFPSV